MDDNLLSKEEFAMGVTNLPCGCVMDTTGDTFIYQPCSPVCEFWLYTQSEMQRLKKEVHYIVDPEIGLPRR